MTETRRKWIAANKQKLIADRRKYYLEHKREAAASNRSWMRNKRKKDSLFRLRTNISSTISTALKTNKKGLSWEIITGYSVAVLRQHLEAQFTEGMTWKNYGKNGWVVDHIKPQCSFHFETFEDPQFKECWALANLRPLWEKENLAKVSSDKKFSLKGRIQLGKI